MYTTMNKPASKRCAGIAVWVITALVVAIIYWISARVVRATYYDRTGQVFRLINYEGDAFVEAHGRSPNDIKELDEWYKSRMGPGYNIADGMDWNRFSIIRNLPNGRSFAWMIYHSDRKGAGIAVILTGGGALWLPDMYSVEEYLGHQGQRLEYHSISKKAEP